MNLRKQQFKPAGHKVLHRLWEPLTSYFFKIGEITSLSNVIRSARELNLTWANVKQSLGCLCKEPRIVFMKISFLKRQVRQLDLFCPNKNKIY